MTLLSKISAFNNKFDALHSATTSLPGGVQAQVGTARSQYLAAVTTVPAQLSSFYGNFTSNMQTLGAMTKAMGTGLTDNPSHTICGAVSFLASGDFLNSVGTKIDQLLAAISSGITDLAEMISDFFAEVDKVVGITAALQEIDQYLTSAKAALYDFAQTMGAGTIRDALAMARCLTHAAEFTTNQATLIARQAATLSLTPKQVGNLSLQRTGIKDVTNSFTSGIQTRLSQFI